MRSVFYVHLSKKELNLVYCSTIRSVVEYSCQVLVYLPTNLSGKLSLIFKRPHKIICNSNCNSICDSTQKRELLTLNLVKYPLLPDNNEHILHSIM